MTEHDIRTAELKTPIDVAEYLFRRLYEVGVRSVHGVPGDYNLEALDYLPQTGLKWVGNCNELNAGYAADGYARVNGISALITTFGVGELSAINAVAGAYSEYVPIVHIVGMPSTKSQSDGLLLHHTLGNGDFNVFANMSSQISLVTAKLIDPYEIPSQIDYALRECYWRSRPVYIALPTDMVKRKVDGHRLKTPINLKYPPNDPEKEDYVVDVVLKHLHSAKKPVLLVDACAIRHRVLEEVHDLMEKSGFPTFVAPMGKGAIDESRPNFLGVYAGDGSIPEVRDYVESSDLVLMVGTIKSDFNTAGFSYRVSKLQTIEFHSTFTKVKYSEYPALHMKGVLRKLIDRLDHSKLPKAPGVPKLEDKQQQESKHSSEAITHAWFWPALGPWLKERDLVVTETGTANFGIWNTRFPKGVTALNQILWGSIGYSVGATQGAALAALDAEDNRRTILFVGDGSLQMTVQEISTMIRHKLNIIIFVICNEGYTIERLIHGMDASYNDIQPWNNIDLPKAFGADHPKIHQVKTKQQMQDLLADKKFADGKGLQLVEMYMPKKDAPKSLKLITKSKDKAKETAWE